MKFSIFKIPISGIFVALLGAASLPSTMYAANLLTATPTATGTLSCGSAGPTGSVSISVVAATAPTSPATITVSYTLPAGVAVVGASGQSIAHANTPLIFVLTPALACAGLAPGANSITLQFKATPSGTGLTANDVSYVASIPAALLVVSPAALTVTCAYDGVSRNVMGRLNR